MIVNNGQAVVSSRDVAENFGKRHADVLRAINTLDCSKEFNQRNFASVTYKDSKGENRPEYLMNRDGFTFLITGFTGKEAAEWKERYIQAFNEMEKQLTFSLPKTFAEALQLAADQALQLEAAKPAVEFVGRYVETSTTKSIREVAKIVGIPERVFIALMINEKILYRLNNVLVPYANHQHGGHFDVKTVICS